MNSSTGYRPDIDGLRAVAVLPVVFYHVFPSGLNAGFLGVDVFFVISGYLITKIIHEGIQSGEFSARKFYARRIRRIFPTLILVLVSTLIFGNLFLFPNELAELGTHVFAGSVFISNFMLWSEVGYFDNSAWEKVLLHLWSLAVEEQFYIVWPLILWVALVWIRRPLLIVLGLFFASLITYFALFQFDPTAAFYFSPSRFWELLAGALVAIFARPCRMPAIKSNTLCILAMTILIAAFFAGDKNDESLPVVTMLVVLSTAFLIWVGQSTWFNRAILSNRILVWFGLISYPLYLWHWPILAYIRIGQGGSIDISYLNGFAAVFAAVGLAWITYRFFESGIRFNPSRLVVGTLSIAVVVTGGIGLSSSIWSGFPKRLMVDPPLGLTLFQDYPHPQQDGSCNHLSSDVRALWACVISAPLNPDVVLIGDSHANQYYEPFRNLVPSQTILNLSEPGCLPFNSFGSLDCQKKQEEVLNFLADQQDLRSIVVTGYFSFLAAGFQGENREGYRVAAELSPERKAKFIENGRGFLNKLTDLNATIYVLGDIPDLVERPSACLTVKGFLISSLRIPQKQSLIHQDDDCFINANDFSERNEEFRDLLYSLLMEYPEIKFFEAKNAVCTAEACYAIRDGLPLYWNSDHLTLEGGRLVLESLFEKFPELRK